MPDERPRPRARAPAARLAAGLALLALLPALLVGPALLPGRRFLPQLPLGFEPLASEHPAAAATAWEGANRVASDRLFPVLSDELAIRRQLARGTLPAWAPELGFGLPLAAGSLAGPWYPPRWLFLWLAPDVAGGWHALLSLFLAGLGAWLFLARRGLSAAACAFGALATQAGGFGLANLHYVMKVDAALWLSWSLWALEGISQGRRAAGPVLSITTALSFLAGFAPIAFLSLGLAGAWLLTKPHRARAATFLGLGVLAAAVQLVPLFEASAQSTRGAQEAAALEAQALPPAALATLVAPGLFGSPQDEVAAPDAPVVWWLTAPEDAERARAANRLEWNLFAGVAVFLLALAGAAARPRCARFPALALAVVLGFVLGWPLARLLYRLPGLNLGAPARAAALAWILWPWLAANGLQALCAGSRRARVAVAGGAAVLLALGAWIWLALEPQSWAAALERTLAERHGMALEQVRSLLDPAAALRAGEGVVRSGGVLAATALVALALALGARRLGARAGAGLWSALVLCEGALFGLPHLAPRSTAGLPLFPPSQAIEAVRAATGDGRAMRFDQSASGLEDVLALARPNLLAAYGICDATPYVVFPPRRQVEWLAAIDPAGRYRTGVSRLSTLAALDDPRLDRARVTCVLARRPLAHARLAPVFERPGFHVYHRAGARPLAEVVPAGSDAAAWLGGREPPPGFRPGAVRVVRPAADRLVLEVRGSSGGVLLAYEGWAPGWRATLDGEPVDVEPAGPFRAVRVPEGDCVVRMEYAPWSLRLGALGSLLALATSAVVALRSSRG